MAKWLVMWTGSIAAFVIFVTITQILLGGDRGFQSEGDEGFKILYPKDLIVHSAHFLIDATKNPTTILFFAVVDVENSNENSLLAVQVPYPSVLIEDSGWKWKPFEKSTFLVKDFLCNEEPCSFTDDIQYFEIQLDKPIDQKQSYRHSVRLWFSENNPLLDPKISPMLSELNPTQKPYTIGFENIPEKRVTIILDKSSDSFAPIPIIPITPGPYPETVEVDWPLQEGVLHQIDYQLLSERFLETQMLYYTALFGIGLGITNLAIYGAEQRSRKVKADRLKKLQNDEIKNNMDNPDSSENLKDTIQRNIL